MQIRKIKKGDNEDILVLMNHMPEFFSKETIEYTKEIIDKIKGFVCYENGKLVGFIAYDKSITITIKIYWMAVSAVFQGRGIGTQLFKKVEQEVQSEGFKKIELLTLGDHQNYPGYANTRKFYEKMGCKKITSYMDHNIEILTLEKKL